MLAPPAITRPWLDLILVGGLSIVVGIPLFFIDRESTYFYGNHLEWVSLTINIPHFMASYLLLYSSWQTIKRHRGAAVYAPLILIALGMFALSTADATPVVTMGLLSVAGVYTAWHYMGQTWGMMATFTHLSGVPFDDVERMLFRRGLVAMCAWHATHWWKHGRLDWLPEWTWILPLLDAMWWITFAAALVGLCMGGYAFFRYRRRNGHFPDARACVAWLALVFWYALLIRWPASLYWVQYSHALQYLAFPGRVVVNRASRSRFPTWLVAFLVAALVFVVGYWIFRMVPDQVRWVLHSFRAGPGSISATPMMVTIIVNVHHYYTDGAVWRIRNPDVQRDLFAHLRKN